MCFHITTQARNARKRPRKVQGQQMWPASFHILSLFPDHTKPSKRPYQYPGFVSTLLQEVKLFDYLGLRLDPMMTIKAAVASILAKANKGHSLALAVSYSLRYDKHRSIRTFCSSPVQMLNLWKSCVLRHFLLYLRYISDASQVQTLQATLNRSLSTTLHVYGHPTALLADTEITPLYITQNLQLAQFRFRLHSSPLDTIQHSLWQLWQPLLQVVPLNTLKYRMQTTICHVDIARVTLPPLCLKKSPWPNPLTKRNHTRNTLSLDILIDGESTSSLHSARTSASIRALASAQQIQTQHV